MVLADDPCHVFPESSWLLVIAEAVSPLGWGLVLGVRLRFGSLRPLLLGEHGAVKRENCSRGASLALLLPAQNPIDGRLRYAELFGEIVLIPAGGGLNLVE